MFFIILLNLVCVSQAEMHGKWLSVAQSILLLLKDFSNKKIRDWSMSYFQDKDKTSLFCIANLSKLTVCKRFIKWWSRVRFAVAKRSIFWNYISNSNQLKIIISNNQVQYIPILNRVLLMYHLWYIVYYFSEKLGKLYIGLKGHRYIWKYWLC